MTRNETPNHHTDNRGVEAALAEALRATEPPPRAVNVDALLATAAARRSSAGTLRRQAMALAASIAIAALVGASSGRYGARSANRAAAAQMKQTLAESHQRIVADLTSFMQRAHAAEAGQRSDEMKRLALLLREDYNARLAALNFEFARLAERVDAIALTSNTAPRYRMVNMPTE